MGRELGREFLFAAAALCAWLALAPAPAQANHLPQAPECSDMHDNDGDGPVDFPADSNCNSLTDDSEGAASGGGGGGGSTREVWVTFLTQWDNGYGGAPEVVCSHSVLAQPGTAVDNLTLTPVDVNNDCATGPPAGVGVCSTNAMFGADACVGVRVPPDLDVNKPSIKVNSLTSDWLPLRVEAVTTNKAQPTRRKTIGYDALHSTAPRTFTAALELSKQGETDNIKITQNVTSPGDELALVSDDYRPGDTLNDRGSLNEHRVNFRSDDGGAQVPSTVTADLSVSATHQRIALTRREETVMDFLIRRPGDDPKVSGTLDRLPPNARVIVDDVDTDDKDAIPDRKTIVYDADQPVSTARVNVETVRRLPRPRPVADPTPKRPDLCGIRPCGAPKRIRVSSTVTDLPGNASSRDAALVYSSRDDTFDYDASAEVTATRVGVVDEAPLFGRAKYLNIRLEDVPPRLHADLGKDGFDFSVPAKPGEQDHVGGVSVEAYEEPPLFPIPCAPGGGPRCQNHVHLTETKDIYDLGAIINRLKSAKVRLDPDIEVAVDTAPELIRPDHCPFEFCKRTHEEVPVWRTPFWVVLYIPVSDEVPALDQQTLAGRISALQPNTRFQLKKDNGTVIGYSDTAGGAGTGSPIITVDGSNLAWLPTGSAGVRASELHFELGNVPRRLTFSVGKGGFPISLEAAGETDRILDRLDFQMTSGPDHRLPTDECVDGTNPCNDYRVYDGVLIEDLADRYVVHARLRGIQALFLHKFKVGHADALAARMNGQGVAVHNNLALKVDISQQKGANTKDDRIQHLMAGLDELPRRVDLDAVSGPRTVDIVDGRVVQRGVQNTLDYRASANARLLEVHKSTNFQRQGHSYRDQFQNLEVTPLPKKLDICQVADSDLCTDDVIATNRETDAGSLRIAASERIDFHYDTQEPGNVFSVADLSLNQLAVQADAKRARSTDNDAGYFAFDTDWAAPVSGTRIDPNSRRRRHVHPAPPEEQGVTGGIRQVEGTNNELRIDFGDGLFAAGDRFLIWDTSNQLYFGCTPASGCIRRVGHVYCPPGFDFYVAQDSEGFGGWVFEGQVADIELETRLCNTFPERFGFRPPGPIVSGID